ncbi:Protein UBASH3A -like protein [Trichinella zimbabwensis]|uniref:Protein UBASH3A-like protein n=1 Tax=Trichinella zimbabwensis TaxID=268475 RepID=A0A0V1HZ27_9BILA|nr:Protein UBASH3A -like protein [Trichinella zimbabwensis]
MSGQRPYDETVFSRIEPSPKSKKESKDKKEADMSKSKGGKLQQAAGSEKKKLSKVGQSQLDKYSSANKSKLSKSKTMTVDEEAGRKQSSLPSTSSMKMKSKSKKQPKKTRATDPDAAYETMFSVIDMNVTQRVKGATMAAGPVKKSEQRKQAQLLVEASKIVEEALEESPTTGRIIFLARHGEQMDNVFPNWVNESFTNFGLYKPTDLNMPLSLVPRQNGPTDFLDDPPLTEMGYVTSQMIGRGAKLSKVHFDAIYSSPALRCIHSAHGILKAFPKADVQIRIEPGLFEYMGLNRDSKLNFITGEEMSIQGYEIDLDYNPIISAESIREQYRNEGVEDFYQRICDVIESISQAHDNSPCNILIIGHALTLDAGSRYLARKSGNFPTEDQINNINAYFPYSAIVAMEELKDEGKWQLMQSAMPSISSMDFSNRIDFNFFNRE